jgi:hypothetical protein
MPTMTATCLRQRQGPMTKNRPSPVPWGLIKAVWECPSGFLLVFSQIIHSFILIPKGGLPEETREFLAAKVSEFEPDPPMSPEQIAVAASLSSDMVARIDAALLSHARTHERKVAMIVGLAMMEPSARVPGLPDLYYAQRVKSLVEKGLLLAEGNLSSMGRSEVRLAEAS